MKTGSVLLVICLSLANEVLGTKYKTPSAGSGGGSFGLHFFEKIQDIPTKGANDADSFEIDGILYLVIANRYSGTKTAANANTNSVIYKLQGNTFTVFQTIPTFAASGLGHATIGGHIYLAIANQFAGTEIYKWNGSSFAHFQTLSVPYPIATEFFSICEESYLAVGSYRDGNNKNTNSFVYKWKNNHFEQIQAIPTHGAHGITAFQIDGHTYLAFANNHISNGVKAPSEVFKWTGSQFTSFQSLPSSYPQRIHSFEASGHTFLARTNYLDGSTNTDSVINKWSSGAFTRFQAIPTRGAVAFQTMVINGETYLNVANHQDQGTGYKTNSVIYKASGAQFTKYQEIPTVGGFELYPFSYKGEMYLAAMNYWDGSTYHVNSQIYKWV